jgi:hypothetical protein
VFDFSQTDGQRVSVHPPNFYPVDVCLWAKFLERRITGHQVKQRMAKISENSQRTPPRMTRLLTRRSLMMTWLRFLKFIQTGLLQMLR